MNEQIRVDSVLAAWPPQSRFPGIDTLEHLVRELDPNLVRSRLLGLSRGGRPIHHLIAGEGGLRALIVAGNHCMEPIGNATVAGLMTLFAQQQPDLMNADVEWHIVPAVDPDGALLNEGWAGAPFELERYMRGYYLQPPEDQVDTSFPIDHPLCHLDRPSHEAALLRELLDEVQPDFYFPLHNAWTGGGFFYSSRDLGEGTRQAVRALLNQLDLPLQHRPIWREICASYDTGFVELFSMRKYYDYLAATEADATSLPNYGAASWDYLAERNPDALSFVAEVGYARHPADESELPSGRPSGETRLALDACCKGLASSIIEFWADTDSLLNRDSPFFRALAGGMIVPSRKALDQGGPPISRYPTAEILSDPNFDAEMSIGELFTAAIVDGGFQYLPSAYQFVRLLRSSGTHPKILTAVRELEERFSAALSTINAMIDLSAFRPMAPDQLAKLQLGAGLHVLNGLLRQPARVGT